MPHFGAAGSSPHAVSILPMRAVTGTRFENEQGLNSILGGFCPRKRQRFLQGDSKFRRRKIVAPISNV